MTKRCMEEGCQNRATNTLYIDLTDRTELFHLCEFHYVEAEKQIKEVKESVNRATDADKIERLKELLSPDEFNAVMEELGFKERIYIN